MEARRFSPGAAEADSAALPTTNTFSRLPRVAFGACHTTLRGLRIAKMNMKNIVAASRQITAEVHLERMPNVVMYEYSGHSQESA